MKKIIVILAVVGMVGCSSMAELRSGKPEATFYSNKNIDEVSECILSGWQENSVRYGDVFIQPYKGGKTVYTPNSTEVSDVVNVDGKTQISFYHQSGIFSYRINSRLDAIKRCI